MKFFILIGVSAILGMLAAAILKEPFFVCYTLNVAAFGLMEAVDRGQEVKALQKRIETLEKKA